MKMILTLLLAMSASGTLAFLVYLLAVFLTHEQISAHLRYLILKICLAFFLIPFPLLKYVLVSYFEQPYSSYSESVVFLDVAHSVNLTDSGLLLPYISLFYRILLIGWVAILTVIILSQIISFLIFRKNISNNMTPDECYLDSLYSLKNTMHISSDVKILRSDTDLSPFTCGLFHPLIILTSLVDDASADMILRHELQHIKNHDFLYRVIALLAVLLHCFNPIIYLFFKELKEVQEMNCDEKLTVNFTPAEKKAYGNILIDIASRSGSDIAPVIYFSKTGKSALKKRIRKIISPVHRKKSFVLFLLTCICFTASVPVCAYSPSTIDWRGSNETPDSLQDTNWFAIYYDDSYSPWDDLPEDEHAFLNCNEYFILEDGTILPVTDNFSATPYKTCQHTFKMSTFKRHQKQGKGCIVTTWRAQVCTKCHYKKNLIQIETDTHTICHHK